MSQVISYMGTKRQLAPSVCEMVGQSREGPLLDLFAGMCSVGLAVAPYRSVWSNDLQRFAVAMARVLFCGKEFGSKPVDIDRAVHSEMAAHVERLQTRYSNELAAETIALSLHSAAGSAEIFAYGSARANNFRQHEGNGLYELFVSRYGGTYLGYKQAIEFDSLRKAIDSELSRGGVTEETHLWACVALCVALSKCATTTGHFAQPLLPKDANFRRHKAQRARSIRTEWRAAMESLRPIGASAWRKKNRAFNADAGTLIDSLQGDRHRPSVIYADPPYTKDQYSRYYHLYETAILYDYPVATGQGLYRADRPSSTFSSTQTVRASFDELIRGCASLGSDLIISYPTNGLLDGSFNVIPGLIQKHYRKRPEIVCIEHAHSTLGASKGAEHHVVTEVLFRASRS